MAALDLEDDGQNYDQCKRKENWKVKILSRSKYIHLDSNFILKD